MSTLTMAVSDGMTVAWRSALKIKRNPDYLGAVIIQPIMFVLLFAFVFGDSIEIPGMDYREYMLPGIFVQTAIFGAALSGYALTEDLQKGIIDRFRALPMARSAVLVGRTTADLISNVTSLTMMVVMGLVVGWRIHEGIGESVLALLLLLLSAYALSWIMVTGALLVRTPEAFNGIINVAIFPVVFVSNVFVDSDRLPGPLRVFAEWNPTSAITQAVRELFGNTSPALATADAWPMRNALAASLLWILVILAVCVPLSTRLYKKAVSR